MKKSLILLASVILSGVAFQGCKKAEGDPFISLHSRKARVVGEWTITSGSGTSKDITVTGTITTTTSKTWTYDGAQKTGTTTTTVGTVSNTTPILDKYTDKYTFVKDGTFKIETTDNNGSTSTVDVVEGVWNFTGKVGDYKGRSQITLNATKITSGGTVTTYGGTGANLGLFDIYQLKNKEMILKTSYNDASGSDSYTEEASWTLTQ